MEEGRSGTGMLQQVEAFINHFLYDNVFSHFCLNRPPTTPLAVPAFLRAAATSFTDSSSSRCEANKAVPLRCKGTWIDSKMRKTRPLVEQRSREDDNPFKMKTKTTSCHGGMGSDFRDEEIIEFRRMRQKTGL